MPLVSAVGRKPSYFDLYGQSALRYSDIKLAYLDELAKIMFTVSPIEGSLLAAAKPIDDKFKKYCDLIIDICEKLGFVLLSIDGVRSIESKHEMIDGAEWFYLECVQVKYHVYNCIFNAKAVSDSVSVLLNDLSELGYKKGEIDLIKEKKFRSDFIQKSKNKEFSEFWEVCGPWLKNLGQFRDALIHRQSIPVFFQYAKDKMVIDLRPAGVTIVNGKETVNFELSGSNGTFSGANFKFKGLDVIAPWKLSYVMPNDIASYDEGARKNKLYYHDFQPILEFCRLAFKQLRSLSEIAFKETFNKIATP